MSRIYNTDWPSGVRGDAKCLGGTVSPVLPPDLAHPKLSQKIDGIRCRAAETEVPKRKIKWLRRAQRLNPAFFAKVLKHRGRPAKKKIEVNNERLH